MSHKFRFLAKRRADAMWVISDEELHHLLRVLRLKCGASVEVFDGESLWAEGVITSLDAKEAVVSEAELVTAEPTLGYSMALGALKAGELDEVFPYLVELGVSSIHVFRQGHDARFRVSESNQSRWQRIILTACKQSKRVRLPQLFVWDDLPSMLSEIISQYDPIFYLDPASEQSLVAMETKGGKQPLGIVGSEAGFTPKELMDMKHLQLSSYYLGSATLRAKTAAIAASTLISTKCE